MSLKIVVDMCLSPLWVGLLEQQGWPTAHWSAVGDPRDQDATIMEWARRHGHMVFTNDLDFGTTLFLTRATGPSVFQIRGQALFPHQVGDLVIATLRQHEEALIAGALVVLDRATSRVRILPIGSSADSGR